ncbi:MAG: aminoacyl-tRNA hydrolase [Bacteriovoracaceae bacterium]|nr:aminoacyl-tRNA hydrolase [Bacteriovoracaceae bacterium]
MDRLVVALGNPGREYEETRHNIGQMILEKLSFHSDLVWKSKFKGQWASKETELGKVYFLVPETYMNLSGESVAPLCKFFKVSIENILVVHDELDLPYGTLMFKNGGGLAGHNGLKSIAQLMGGQSFTRLRVGIGRPERGSVSDFVLSTFSSEEKINIDDVLELGAKGIESFCEKGFEKTAKSFGKKSAFNG